MTKKDKGPKIQTITTKSGEKIKAFEDLNQFETFLKQETEDDEFDNLHCQIKYYPPFIMHDCHEDPEKIPNTANSNSKKFVRHLHQHVEKHLLKDIREALDIPELQFKDHSKEKESDHITWHYHDVTTYHDKKFQVNVNVTCNHEDALVNLEYQTLPI
ncbi:hypothetical protein TPHA_0K00880 [Tetrapisispora phaffii CBS 4417]|uniref:Respiratory growth induced protein 1 n=1 Tax=Tetrapisispora phaffii (strain ATCC 24235 / CBS 4417 / NBRC 1672 / NRRL Y-8282 / UCD 70-5) TaxID=1071381 RepID=G8BZ94_TETPH|nr:hypothetical protein TPHA_0K00880 [Tetrapisispora phaffii CBS 4417]CCE65222.1 hypothetical protein TPHA_0K00880 [Tetrapisispora phaffii CBS 4417]